MLENYYDQLVADIRNPELYPFAVSFGFDLIEFLLSFDFGTGFIDYQSDF
jgi:hypothetical protein